MPNSSSGNLLKKAEVREFNKLVAKKMNFSSHEESVSVYRYSEIKEDVYDSKIDKVTETVGQTETKKEPVKTNSKLKRNTSNFTNVFTILSPIIPVRRVTSVPKKIYDNDYPGAVMTLAVAGILFPEDMRDMRDAVRQLNSIILSKKLKDHIASKNKKFYDDFVNYAPKFSPKEFQVPFSFVRGSLFDDAINKQVNKFGYLMHKFDQPLIDTGFGKAIQNLLNVKVVAQHETSREVYKILRDETGNYVHKLVHPKTYALSGSGFGKLICRGLQRATVYGVATLCLANIPSIFKAFTQPKDTKEKFANAGNQTIKTIINVVTGVGGIALGGAFLGALGPLGSVIGMGLGCTLGTIASNIIYKELKISANYLRGEYN